MNSLLTRFLVLPVVLLSFAAVANNSQPYPVVWFELQSADIAASKDFYSKMFGWQFSKGPVDEMLFIEAGGNHVGGLIESPKKPGEGGTTIYFEVNALKPALAKAISLGATQVLEAITLPNGHGHVAIFRDTQNALIGLYSAKLD